MSWRSNAKYDIGQAVTVLSSIPNDDAGYIAPYLEEEAIIIDVDHLNGRIFYIVQLIRNPKGLKSKRTSFYEEHVFPTRITLATKNKI